MEQILKVLENCEKSTTEIAFLINKNYYSTLQLLEKLEKEKKIKKTKINKYTFWRIK